MAFLDMLLLHIYQLQDGVSIIVHALGNQKIHSLRFIPILPFLQRLEPNPPYL